MDSPKVTVAELLDENRRLRAAHEKDIAALKATLRDQLAGQALRSAADAVCGHIEDQQEAEALIEARRHARAAYMVADAMLRAREAF